VEFSADNEERLGMDPKALALPPGGRNEVQDPEAFFLVSVNGRNFVIAQGESS
jgi:hypothetical protein